MEEKIQGLFLLDKLSEVERRNVYDKCVGCLNRICITDDKEEVLTLLAALNVSATILAKNTFLRIDG